MDELEKDEFRTTRNLYFAVLPLAGLLILFLTPDRFEALSPAWSGFIDFMMRVVPGIRPLVEVSTAPAATAAFLAFFWALIPLMIALNLRWRAVELRGHRKAPTTWKTVVWWVIVFTLPLQLYIGLDMGRLLIPMTIGARIVLGISGALLFWFVSALLTVQCLMLAAFLRNGGRLRNGSTP